MSTNDLSYLKSLGQRLTELKNRIATEQGEIARLKHKLAEADTSVMSTKELKEYAMSLPPIREDLWEDMQNYGFQTGSTVFGPKESIADPLTDIDYVCQLPVRPFIDSNCAVLCGKRSKDYIDDDSDYFVPMYGNRDGQLYNIICIGPQAKFDAWRRATILMIHLKRDSVSLNDQNAFDIKWKRVRLFRALCDVLEPVQKLYAPYFRDQALEYRICKRCGREAVNFTCKPERDLYEETGICERCRNV